MVQNMTMNPQVPNAYGSVRKVGSTQNGRMVYDVIDGEGKTVGKMSVAAQHVDLFEKSYRDILDSAPKLQKYMSTTTPEKLQKQKKTRNWMVAIGAALGGAYPLFKYKGGSGSATVKALKQIGLTALGTIGGLIVGAGIAVKVTSPPGAMKLNKAARTLSKLDIQQVAE